MQLYKSVPKCRFLDSIRPRDRYLHRALVLRKTYAAMLQLHASWKKTVVNERKQC